MCQNSRLLHKSPTSSYVLCKGAKGNHANDHLLCSVWCFFLTLQVRTQLHLYGACLTPTVCLRLPGAKMRSRREQYGLFVKTIKQKCSRVMESSASCTLIRAVTLLLACIFVSSITLVHLPCRNESGWTELTGVWIQLLCTLIYSTSDLIAEEDRRQRLEHTYASPADFSPR